MAGFEGKDQDKSLGSGGVRPLLCTSLLVGVSPAECLVLADSPTGLTAPAKASMRSDDVRDKKECAELASQLNPLRKRPAK